VLPGTTNTAPQKQWAFWRLCDIFAALKTKSSNMSVTSVIQAKVISALGHLYGGAFDAGSFQLNQTKPEFEGDYTVVLFSLVKQLKKTPDGLGNELGQYLVSNHADLFTAYNVIKGFLNLTIADDYWINLLQQNYNNPNFGKAADSGKKVMVEYSSPNTNKPLHLGHLRNNFLGWSIAEILKANGNTVTKTCIVNDRGVHICKSMLAWQKMGNGATPASTGIKGDHLVGDYYVQFENELKQQTAPLLEQVLAGNFTGFEGEALTKLQLFVQRINNGDAKAAELKDEVKELVRNNTPIMQEVRTMLLKWEEGDADTLALWKQMNEWVYAGFNETYKRIGSNFDKTYYESSTYLLGKKTVQWGLDKGVFFKKEDGSVWIDLTADGLDEKLVQRKDGTSVYITQDLGLAQDKYNEYRMNQSIYVVGDEQNYHMKVLKLICQKLDLPNADGIYHLSYGMVELPTGRMKSREGTVVDADDLVDEMEKISAQHTEELGKVKDFTSEELKQLYHTLGMGALKFYLLRVEPKKKMVFNPEESIDFHGFTGPFIQYTHARIKSILRKEAATAFINMPQDALLKLEKELLVQLEQYSTILQQAAAEHNPSVIASYTFHLAKAYNSFYTEHSVGNAETPAKKELRLQLCQLTAAVIASAIGLLGIQVPERM
jgi:arginyl-tRNA synthetase